MKPLPHRSPRNSTGSTLVVALLMLLVLSLVGAHLLRSVSSRYDYTQKAIGWQKSLQAAEAGAEFGLAQCRWSVNAASAPWTGWKKYDTSTQTWVTLANAAAASSELAAGKKIIYNLPSDSHLVGTGEGSTDLWYHVEVDAPASMVVRSNTWYRIRSTGYAGLPGMARANYDSDAGAGTHNDQLRKFDLRNDHFIKRYGDYANAAGSSVAVSSPRAARRVELIAKPKGPYGIAMVTKNTPNSPTLDSFDSTDLANFPGGIWNPTARNTTTGVGCNGDIYIDSAVSNSAVSSPIYGNVMTNAGTVTKTAGIWGTVNNSTVITIPPVTKPSWTVVAGSPATTLTASTSATTYRSWTSINNLTVALPVGSPVGATGVVNVYVTGNIAGQITVGPGVMLKIYFEGNANVKPPTNQNNRAENMQFYGINPPANTTRTFSIDGNNIADGLVSYFTVDAPAYDMTNNANPNLCGAWIAKSISDNGKGLWHYDEALANAGDPVDYKRAMWVEDER